MARETQKSTNTPGCLELEIEFGMGDILDSYRHHQEGFFAACRYYAGNISSESYSALEATTQGLKPQLQESILAIASRQESLIRKIRMSHGFIVADDAMRTALFRELAPNRSFIAFGETLKAVRFEQNIPYTAQTTSEEDLLAMLTDSAANFLEAGVISFGEKIAVGKDLDS
jgi:hypothetical protein